ncbi:MAG: hypothetical protein MJ075_02955, partial [Oscillospiraceae bacterium]|nr:hypothetical protein [Oscillospiraceae bacterium]
DGHIVICDVGAGDARSEMYNNSGEVEEKHNFGTNGQHMTVGGQLADGSDATNPMTIGLLMAAGRMRFTDPSISCRVHDNTPDTIWTLAIECSKINGGVPTLENDKVIINALMRRGISEVDARNYCIVGCVEPTVGGLEYAACGGNGKESFFNMVGCIIGAIHNGCNPATGYDKGPKTGYLYDYKTFEEFQAAYVTNLKYYLGYQASLENLYEFMYGNYYTPVACSATMEGCMESGKDVMFGGAKYNSVGLTGCGIGNVADCLATIKKFCFDEKSVSTREMYDALCANWVGYENLRQRIITECPHYGNNDDYVDELCVWAMNQFCDTMTSMRNHRAAFAPSTFTMTVHVDFGKRTAATPDGRAFGDPLCDAISSRQGFDTNGPTAYLCSAAKLPHYKISNGDQLNIRFSPSSVAGEDGNIKLRQMIETYFDLGGMQVQFNVVSTDMLHDAQDNPDAYENLVVRIAGFSAYFVEMPKGMQDDFISRTEQQA